MGGAGEGAEAFAGLERVGADERLAVFAPEGVIAGRAKGLGEPLDIEVIRGGRAVAKDAGILKEDIQHYRWR